MGNVATLGGSSSEISKRKHKSIVTLTLTALTTLARIWRTEGVTEDNSTLSRQEFASVLYLCICGCSRVSDTEEPEYY
ncbi:hypothetical protein F0562_005721 [Nyssa sinensis]|uniref:Uncharacterized protein n=1 Tax=Nyssa sinensis TaxID=561372 RepID=A0A5J5ALC3_9ASTE|nr:hypothetical protein F0562_005721 [Nyssa sinensis]